MLQITMQYIPYETDVAFLRIKQDYIHLLHYRISFFVHVYSSLFVLLAGFSQFSDTILKKARKIHRIAGRLYVIVVLLLSAPSGFIIGLYANGGISSRVAFCLLAVLWFTYTLLAFTSIRKGNLKGHKAFMYRSYALALSAITLRAWKYLIVFLLHPRPMDVYRIVAWLGWVPNLFIAELIIRKRLKK
ncbi:MAG TPA: DUF2306 domain-containing protein [Bacteroidia bacterium]